MLYFNLALLLSTVGAFMVAPSARSAAVAPRFSAHTLPRLAPGPLMQEGEGEAAPEPEPEPEAEFEPPPGWDIVPPDCEYPDDSEANIRIEGGQTLQTFKMPLHAERVQYIIKSPGTRPLKARVELWIGPIRCVHELIYDCMNGFDFPLRATLKFKKLAPILKIATDSNFEFPLQCGVFVPTPEESKKIGTATTDMFYSAPLKEAVQGGMDYENTKGGAIKTFAIDPTWEKTQIMVWSVDVGKKSFKTNIEVLQGPNNAKQHLNLRCGGSTQPYHAVIDTPGDGWIIRCNSKKFLEDGKFEIAVAPYGELVEAGPQVVVGGAFV